MKYLDDLFFIYDSDAMIRGDDLSLKNLERLENIIDFSVDLYPNTKLLIPKLVNPKGEQCINLKGGYLSLTNFYDNPSVLTKLSPNITLNDAEIILDVVKNVHYRASNIKLKDDIKIYLLGNLEALAEYKNQFNISDISYKTDNRTLYQETEFDKLFVELPATSLILSFIDENIAPIPSLTNICEPYPSILYYTTSIRNILTVPVERRLKEVEEAVECLADQKIKTPSAITLTNEFKEIPENYVFGDPSNDNLPIQDNEKDYYEALITFIKYHINLFNSSLLSGQELENKNKRDFETCNLPKRLEVYLSSLLESITLYHYSHTGRFKITRELYLGEDNGGYNEDENEIELGYLSTHRGSDANVDIEGYINLSGREYSASVWAEALVKLCRWGSRKPESLILGDKNKNICSLDTFQIRTAVVNLSQANKIVYEDNRSYTLIGYSMNTFIRDDLAEEMPSILVLEEFYSNPENEEDKIRVLALVTFQDLVTEYRNGRGFVHGLEYNSGVFKVDLKYECLDMIPLIQLSKINQVPAIPSFMEFCNKHDISGVKGMSYAFVHSDVLSQFIPDTEDYLTYIAKEPSMVRYNALYGSWLSVFNKTAKSEISIEFLSEFLNDYDQEIYDKFNLCLCGGNTLSVPVISKSMMFEDMVEVEGEDNMLEIYDGDLSNLKFVPINSRKQNPNNPKKPIRVGFVASTDNKYIFASIDDNVNFDPLSTPVTFVGYALLLFGASLGKQVDNKSQVVSSHTLVDIYNAIIKDI